MFFPAYHKSLESLHINTKAPRSYYIPYGNIQTALTRKREKSDRFLLLNGQWSFRFFESFEDFDDRLIISDTDLSDFDDITVPRCWQTYTDRDYDKPLYSNLQYPFPTDPPFVPEENPCGLYAKDIELHPQKDRCYLNFEGVSSCFYVFINGRFAGYSQVSHCSSEFDITNFLQDGINRFRLLVVKWCDGTYLEDQDFFRLSGIFRDVYLLSRPQNHVEDINVETDLSEDLTSCQIHLNCSFTAEVCPVRYAFYDGKNLLQNGEGTDLFVKNPKLWNAEQPHCYTLVLFCQGEIIPLLVGFSRFEIKNKVLLLNNHRVVLKGINRHDSNPDTGYAVDYEHMKRDLLLLKRANVNAIRTSHYPNAPVFTELCCELGFYLINEADIETHGMGYEVEGEWDWMRWSFLSSSPDWKQAYVDRAARLYERDKNLPCVVLWSLGNESGCGINHRAMASYIRSRNPKALIHYENSHKEFKAIPQGENFSDISDVESRMYAGIDYIETYLKDDHNQKPFYMCEYVCSMSTGDVYDYFRFADEYDNFCGGCIWELTDHAINVPDGNGKARYYYGGDFNDKPNDGICCIDGLVFPDRSPRPGYYDMKKVYEPLTGSYQNGRVTLKNRLNFTDVSHLSVKWNIQTQGETIQEGSCQLPEIPPNKTADLFLFTPALYQENTFLNLSFVLNEDTVYAEKGFEAGFLQFELGQANPPFVETNGQAPCIKETERKLFITAGENKFCFDKPFGRLESFEKAGTELLCQPICFDIWRAPTYNGGSKERWFLERFDRIKQKTYQTTWEQKEDRIMIHCVLSLSAHSCPPVIRMTADWVIYPDGAISVCCNGTVRPNAPLLPHLGLLLKLPAGFEDVDYFGKGPFETYPDRHRAARYDLYHTTVANLFTHYIRPQENGNRFATRFAKISSPSTSLSFRALDGSEFCFKASHYATQTLVNTAHDFELVPENETYLNIDYKVNAISENIELDIPKFSRNFGQKEFSFGFVME